MKIQKITIGGWFQRTTLHLTEMWDFLKHGTSRLDFPKKELEKARARLDVRSVRRENGPLEYIAVETQQGVSYRIYEDGLIVLEKEFRILKKDFEEIKEYYDSRLSKSLSYIFSKGAPVPKELAHIQTILPYVITCTEGGKEEILKIFKNSKEEVYSVLETKNVAVYRSSGIICINNLRDEALLREVIEAQIFFREFKSQLHRYLAIHRTLWEKISDIKERGSIRGTEVDALRGELGDYQKTVNLIGARINQMGVYLRTRQKVADLQKVDEYLNPLFQFKFETLQDTHEYIKHLWDMTKNYLASAIEVFVELQNKSTKNTISSLQLITTIGVVAGIVGYLSKDSLPTFTGVGIFYFGLLLFITWLINSVVSRIYKSKKYEIRPSEIVRDIK